MQDTLPQGGFMELSAKQAIDWVGLQMNDLSGDDLASRPETQTHEFGTRSHTFEISKYIFGYRFFFHLRDIYDMYVSG